MFEYLWHQGVNMKARFHLLRSDAALQEAELLNDAVEGRMNEQGIEKPSKMWEASGFAGLEEIGGM